MITYDKLDNFKILMLLFSPEKGIKLIVDVSL